MNQSHTFTPLEHSNISKISQDGSFLVTQEEPLLALKKLLVFDFFQGRKTCEISFLDDISNDMRKTLLCILQPEESLFEFENACVKQATFVYKMETNEVKLNGSNEIPELKMFLAKQSSLNIVTYEFDEGYKLSICNDQAYIVINEDGRITAAHIDESLGLRQGDNGTIVWRCGNNFAVYNYGYIYSTVYSVVFISEV